MEKTTEDYIPKLGKCGLRNIGNTCYMNSILQLLLHCKPLISFLMKKKKLDKDNETEIEEGDYEYYLEKVLLLKAAKDERKRLRLGPNDEVSVSKIIIEQQKVNSITFELAKIVDTMINKGASIITPHSFKQSLDKKISAFRGYSQQDAHEFIIHVLDMIMEETGNETEPQINNIPQEIKNYFKLSQEYNRKIKKSESLEEKKTFIGILNNYRKKHSQVISKYDGLKYLIDIYKKQYNPFIYQIQSILVNEIECSECKNITCSYENTPIIQLYVNDSLQESFEQLVKTESIENYKCLVCDVDRLINKTCKIWRTPSVLFIQLKRFEVLSNGRIRKNNLSVDIPLTIDLSPYCDETMLTDKKINRKYNLKGFSNHLGSLNGGHYTADCLCIVDNETWYKFDDSHVSRNTNKMIDTSNAYILMYEQEYID